MAYRVGEIAYLKATKPDKKPYIVLIEKIWQDGSENMVCSLWCPYIHVHVHAC